ncbi:efflux RND transporter periplasmic adaptor subunit [Legionella sp. CNM-1927-20]|uniref:efflux RND transporter periplasmic adaptor subunit n=1 Tax=Legionella sp. CNM-1927-20 TaxID=3422221 RepID=UPI00403AFF5B
MNRDHTKKYKKYTNYQLLNISRWATVILSILIFLLATISYSEGNHATQATSDQQPRAKGPHGGRLLTKDNIAVEITMFERGMPPHFRVFLYENNKLIIPNNASLQITLKRFSGEKNFISFKPIGEFLQSVEVINEPHSFDVNVILHYNSKTYSWSYSSYEGRITIEPEVAAAAGIKVKIAGGMTLEKKLTVIGKISPNRDTLAKIIPRYAGIIKNLTKSLGESVRQGEVLAVIESNENLQNYTVASPISGTVVRKQATIGELATGNQPIYEIANLDTVWIDLTLYRKDVALVKKGMKVTVIGDEGIPRVMSKISYVSPFGIENSQTTFARVILPNNKQQWLPGMYVKASITLAEKTVKVAVPRTALQHWRDWDVVFVQKGNQYEIAIVEIGEQDNDWLEIRSGLKPGQAYVAENSFFLKADLGKAGASHDH